MPKKTRKKTEPTAAADAPAMRREPDEPELAAASESKVEGETEVHPHADMPVAADEGLAEATAEAADTFEQAFEERLPSERQVSVPSELRISEGEHEGPDEPAEGEEQPEAGDEFTPAERPPARLERLQKILSQAGVASRRHAEEMITQGRVQVNGKLVTELGSKADPERDHIRVDGKLLRGAERLRYFALNKPRGYVTTVSDPEGRPTVMQFFQKMNERLYPVGRLDYQSEGLLLVTNDGELANKLTRAASGVEKTYLVKVSGRPGPEELDQLRAGLAIDRTRPGEGRVWTAPATVREVRSGDNPWYEVVLTEGRNRELRKMFEEIGHHVEKIRRVGYGPLVLDLEPGRFRELEPEEVAQLRLAAEGKLPKPKRPEHRTQEFKRRSPGVRQRPEEQGGRGANRRNGEATRSRPGQRGQEWRREDRGRRGEAAAGSGRSATPFKPAGGRDQARPRGREDRAFGSGQDERYEKREDRRQAGSGTERQRRGGGPGFDRRQEGRGFQGGTNRRTGSQPGPRDSAGGQKFGRARAEGRTTERTGPRPGPRDSAGGQKFGRGRAEGRASERTAPRPGTRGSAGGQKFGRGQAEGRTGERTAPRPGTRDSSGERSGKRYPSAGQGRPASRGERRPPSRPANRRNSPPSRGRSRGPGGNRS